MNTSTKRFVFLLICSVVMYFSNLGGTSIYILDEAKNAQCAREMMERGDPIVPTFNGTLRTDKPPLHYYCMMLAYKIFGVNAFAARFFSAIAGILVVLLIYRNVSTLVHEQAGWYAAFILLSSIQLTVQFHLAVPDPYLILFMVSCLLAFFQGIHRSEKYFWWMYVAAAMGFLTKGLVAIVLPGLIVLTYLLLTKQFTLATIGRLKLIPGITLFSFLVLPWYVAVGVATDGEWLRGFFIGHNLNRYTTTMEGHRGFPLAPFAILGAALLPASVFLVQSVRHTWQSRKENPFLLFCLIICVVFCGFFSLSKTILPSYPAPAIPFLAIMLGYVFWRLEEVAMFSRRGIFISSAAHLAIATAIAVGGFIALQHEASLHTIKNVTWILLPLPVGALIGGIVYLVKRKTAPMLYTWMVSWMVVILLFFYVANPVIDKQNPVTKSLQEWHVKYSGRKVVSYKSFNPAYPFNLGRTIPVIETADALARLTRSGEKVVIITRGRYLPEITTDLLLTETFHCDDLFETTETVLLVN